MIAAKLLALTLCGTSAVPMTRGTAMKCSLFALVLYSAALTPTRAKPDTPSRRLNFGATLATTAPPSLVPAHDDDDGDNDDGSWHPGLASSRINMRIIGSSQL